MDSERIAEFSESLSRCLADPTFLDRFYELFRGSSAEVAEKFRNTDLERQKRALTSSLYLMVMAMERGEAATSYLEVIARRHGRADLDIRPELYDLWLDCLVSTAREYDPQFSDDLEVVWRETMRFGIEFMRDRY